MHGYPEILCWHPGYPALDKSMLYTPPVGKHNKPQDPRSTILQSLASQVYLTSEFVYLASVFISPMSICNVLTLIILILLIIDPLLSQVAYVNL